LFCFKQNKQTIYFFNEEKIIYNTKIAPIKYTKNKEKQKSFLIKGIFFIIFLILFLNKKYGRFLKKNKLMKNKFEKNWKSKE